MPSPYIKHTIVNGISGINNFYNNVLVSEKLKNSNRPNYWQKLPNFHSLIWRLIYLGGIGAMCLNAPLCLIPYFPHTLILTQALHIKFVWGKTQFLFTECSTRTTCTFTPQSHSLHCGQNSSLACSTTLVRALCHF